MFKIFPPTTPTSLLLQCPSISAIAFSELMHISLSKKSKYSPEAFLAVLLFNSCCFLSSLDLSTFTFSYFSSRDLYNFFVSLSSLLLSAMRISMFEYELTLKRLSIHFSKFFELFLFTIIIETSGLSETSNIG